MEYVECDFYDELPMMMPLDPTRHVISVPRTTTLRVVHASHVLLGRRMMLVITLLLDLTPRVIRATTTTAAVAAPIIPE